MVDIQVNTLVGVITVLILLAGVLATIVAYYKSSLNTKKTELLESTNKAQTERIAFVEEDNIRKNERIKLLEDAVAVLQETITGKETLDKILRETQQVLGICKEIKRLLVANGRNDG